MPRALAEVPKPISPRDRAGATASGDALAPYSAFIKTPTLATKPEKPPAEPPPPPKPVEVPGPILIPPRPGRPGEGQPSGLYTIPNDGIASHGLTKIKDEPQTNLPVDGKKKKDEDADSQRVPLIPEQDDTWESVIGGRSGSTQRATRENPNPSNTPPPPPSPYRDRREKKP